MNAGDEFVITNDVQRIEMWGSLGARSGQKATAAARTAEQYAAAVLVPVYGKAVQRPGTVGFDPDGFMLQHGSFRFLTMDDVSAIAITGWLPEHHGRPIEILAACCSAIAAQTFDAATRFMLELPVTVSRGVEEQLRIGLSASFVPSALPGGSSDNRHLGCIIVSVLFA